MAVLSQIQGLFRGSLRFGTTRLDFIGECAKSSYLNLDISPSLFVTPQPCHPIPASRHIKRSERDYKELRHAIASDVSSAVNGTLQTLRQYLTTLKRFSEAWNYGRTAELRIILEASSGWNVAPFLARLNQQMHHFLPDFQNFYLSHDNFTASHELLTKAKASIVYKQMCDKFSLHLSRRIDALISNGAVKSASDLSSYAPNEVTKDLLVDKINKGYRSLVLHLEEELACAINAYDLKGTLRILDRARNEGITELCKTQTDSLSLAVCAIEAVPNHNLQSVSQKIGSLKTTQGMNDALADLLRYRIAAYTTLSIKCHSYDVALEISRAAVEKASIVKKNSHFWRKIRDELLDHVATLSGQGRAGGARVRALNKSLHNCAALFAIFEIEYTLLATHVCDQTEKLLSLNEYQEARRLYLQAPSVFGPNQAIRRRLVTAFARCRRRIELGAFRANIQQVLLPLFEEPGLLEFPQPRLQSSDFQLMAKWNGHFIDPSSDDLFSELIRHVGKHKALQHRSARSAEIVAIDVYRNLEGSASDLSIQQLSSKSNEWAYADIRTSERYIDIKSARSAFNCANRFSEFCVKEFKTISLKDDVVISSFFSEYKTLRQIKKAEDPSYLWLGEISKDRLDRVLIFIKEKFGSLFSVDDFSRSVEKSSFFPGWLFEYPDCLYSERLDNVEELKALFHRAQQRSAVPEDLQKVALLLANHEKLPRDTPSEKLISNALSAMIDEVGASRGALFLTIIAVSITALRRGIREFYPSAFRRFLFQDYSEDSKACPLGLFDPLGYIDELIECLDVVFSNSRERLLEFRRFRLAGHGILLGESSMDHCWKTILAYCGGWDQEANVKCGNAPLVIGNHNNCTNCGKLICNECGFCNERCPNCYTSDPYEVEFNPAEMRRQRHWHQSRDNDIPF